MPIDALPNILIPEIWLTKHFFLWIGSLKFGWLEHDAIALAESQTDVYQVPLPRKFFKILKPQTLLLPDRVMVNQMIALRLRPVLQTENSHLPDYFA